MRNVRTRLMTVVASMALGSAAGAEGMTDPGNAATWALSFQNASTEEAPAGSTRAWRGLLGLDTMPRVVDSAEPQAILINLPITGELPAVLGRTVVGPQGGVTWYGTIDDGTDASFVLAQVGDAIAGAIWHPTWGTIEIRPTGEYSSAGQRQSLILLIDPEAVIDCSTGGVFHEHASFNADVGEIDLVDATVTPRRGVVGGPAACGCGDDGSIIDIMVVYTPIARDSAGGTSAIEAIALASVASINTSFANSGLEDTMVRLVHIHETDFMETQDVPSGDFRAALSRQGDGFMDEVGLLRDQYAADLVALLVNDFGIPGLGGNAFLSPGGADRGVSVTRWNVALGSAHLRS